MLLAGHPKKNGPERKQNHSATGRNHPVWLSVYQDIVVAKKQDWSFTILGEGAPVTLRGEAERRRNKWHEHTVHHCPTGGMTENKSRFVPTKKQDARQVVWDGHRCRAGSMLLPVLSRGRVEQRRSVGR